MSGKEEFPSARIDGTGGRPDSGRRKNVLYWVLEFSPGEPPQGPSGWR